MSVSIIVTNTQHQKSGGHGPKDDNQMPQFVEVVPAYGCAWSMIYEDTGRTISYEGS